MKYGLLTSSAYNIGEEIQTLAAFRFLPRVDYLIHREQTDQFQSDEKVRMIMNHWWLWNPDHFPPSGSIDPLFVSFHLQYRIRNRKFMSDHVIDYLKKHEPVGCRDLGTVTFLKTYGIEAYFSGCLTSTLLPRPDLRNRFTSGYILCVDVPEKAVSEIRKRTGRQIISISRKQNICFSYEQRMKLARFNLFLCHNAFCVVTIALHSALPAVAFGTPVCLIRTDEEDALTRFSGMEDCFNIVELKDLIAGPECYDINRPPENPDGYMKMAEQLSASCAAFTGFDSRASVFPEDYNPLKDMAEITAWSSDSLSDSLLYLSKKELLRALFRRFVRNENRHSLHAHENAADIEMLQRK